MIQPPGCRSIPRKFAGQCMSLLYSPARFGPYTFKNRLVMSPMTRSRALGNVPNDLMLEYYKQRASSAGLIAGRAWLSTRPRHFLRRTSRRLEEDHRPG